MGVKESANESGEAYLKGRKAGVEGTHGQSRGGKGAEKTVMGGGDQSDGGTLDPSLRGAASSMYKRAVGPGEDPSKMGDQALRDR